MTENPFMKRALALATKGKGRTSPNPLVGAVIVKNNQIIAEGFHEKAGTPHAEVVALEKAGAYAKGATLYVNLEPCCHTDKRTPPCTQAIIDAGIKEVVTAMTDPNPKVSGRGIEELQKAGISTKTGVMEAEALKLNESFAKFIVKKVPFVILKIAQSLDGKIATAGGESKWITGPDSRGCVHRLRNDIDAVLVGTGTMIEDNPSLDCRTEGGINPYRIIVDSSLRTPQNSKVLKCTDNKTIIAATDKADKEKCAELESLGATVLRIKEKNGKVDLEKLMEELGRRDITSVLIEGGSSIAASALADGIVDKVMFFIAPKIMGGTDSISSVGGKSPAHLRDAFQLRDLSATAYGDDILVEGYVKK